MGAVPVKCLPAWPGRSLLVRMDWVVAKRAYPCRPTMARPSSCASCGLLHHIRSRWDSRTLCGLSATEMDGWATLGDDHPEDVDAIRRCAHCYRIFEQHREESSNPLHSSI